MTELAKFLLYSVGLVLAGVALIKATKDGFWFILLAVLFLGAAVALGIL